MYEVELRPFKDYNPQNNQKPSSQPASSQNCRRISIKALQNKMKVIDFLCIIVHWKYALRTLAIGL